jgi:signal transduction histidine kinase
MRVVAESKGLSPEAGACGGCAVLGDGPQLRRLLLNLLDNAIKFTRPGGVVRVVQQNATSRRDQAVELFEFVRHGVEAVVAID